MLYRIIASVSNRPNGDWRYATQVPTFYLDSATQGIIHAEHAAQIARDMLAELVRQDLSAGARIVVSVSNDDGTDYASVQL
jgi:hypothetical protein